MSPIGDDFGEMLPPTVVLGVMPCYAAGLPMMVSLTVRNDTSNMLFMGLPFVEWFGNPLDARWVLRTEAGRVLEAGSAELLTSDENGAGFGLDPGEEHTMLVDLAAVLPEVPGGNHTLTVDYPVDQPVASKPTPFEVADLVGIDAEIAQAVVQGTSGEKTWGTFFDGDWVWEQVPPLAQASAVVCSNLTLHLFLHRVFYGDQDVSKLDLSQLGVLTEGPLEAEAAVLRHEILYADGQPMAEQWKQYIAQRWPGLLWRTKKAERGFGFLRMNRDKYQQRLIYRPVGEIDSILRP